MDKKSIAQSIESRYGAFVNISEVAEYLRFDRGTVRALLGGLPYLKNGREKNYFARDVAERIWERREV